MLILVGVTINSAINGGLFGHAQNTITKNGEVVKGGVEIPPSIPVNTNCVGSYAGSYADIDGDGIIDGIIYADLAVGDSVQCSEKAGAITIPVQTGLKEYQVTQTEHTDSRFDGNTGRNVIAPVKGTEGNDRFYIMALENVDSTTHCWYHSAYSHQMPDYASTTSETFGTGKANTNTMIGKWNNEDYGTKNGNASYPDIWGLTQVQDTLNNEWFVPSAEEWYVFAQKFGIRSSNFWEFGVSGYYWSSSQITTIRARDMIFTYGHLYLEYTVRADRFVRLSATF